MIKALELCRVSVMLKLVVQRRPRIGIRRSFQEVYLTYKLPKTENMLVHKFLEPLSILITKYKTSETPKIDNIFIYNIFMFYTILK